MVGSGCSNCQTRACKKCSSFGACSHPLGCTWVLAWKELWHTDGVPGVEGPYVCRRVHVFGMQ